MATIRIMSGGAPKDIFLQLTPQFERQSGHKDGYQKDNVVRAQGRATLGLVSVNAVVRTGAATPDLSTPEKVKQAMLNSRAITHATPGATPSGTHMGKLVEQLGIADAMKGKIIHRPALEGGVQLVASGEAEIGFYPKSEVVNTDDLTVVGPLPAAIQLTTIYGAAVTVASPAPDTAAAFIKFMSDPAHRAAWTHAGFDPPA
jgi:molybdate transport system substrate-binding protein